MRVYIPLGKITIEITSVKSRIRHMVKNGDLIKAVVEYKREYKSDVKTAKDYVFRLREKA